jgi:hypothetical protein
MRPADKYPEKMDVSYVPPLICRDLKVTKRRFNSSNGPTFTPNPGSEIRIPVSGAFTMDNKNTNLNFRLKLTTPAAKTIDTDFSWASLFSQIRVEAGTGSSIVLEQIDDVALWAHFLYQYTWSQEDMSMQNGKQLSIRKQLDVDGILSKTGFSLAASQTGTLIDVSLDLSLFMGLFSSATGLPLYDTAGITVVCVLNQVSAMMVATDATAVINEISNVYISATCLEGGPEYEKKLKEMKSGSNGEVSVMFNTCRRYIQTVGTNAGGTTVQLYIPERSKSCLGFVAMNRLSSTLTDSTSYTNSVSLFPTASATTNITYSYIISGQKYPVSGINTDSELYDEATDLYANLSRRNDSGGLIARNQASKSATYDATSPSCPSHVLAVNLAKCPITEVKTKWGAGMNLSNSNLSIYLEATYAPTAASTVTIFSVFQMKVHIDALGNFTTEY